jgi:hypothetical protein
MSAVPDDCTITNLDEGTTSNLSVGISLSLSWLRICLGKAGYAYLDIEGVKNPEASHTLSFRSTRGLTKNTPPSNGKQGHRLVALFVDDRTP